jgi:DNA modification methylase
MSTFRILVGDCLEELRTVEDCSVQCCITSPPYYGLRDYGHAGQIGLETSPEQYISKMVEVFREVRRVLRDDGTLWLNIGDSYATGATLGCKPKDLIGIPWMLAFALRADGWFLRQDLIWHKPNPMPESVTDRCTKAHEYLFLLTKSARYYYDAEAIAEAAIHAGHIVKASNPVTAKNAAKGRFGATALGFTTHDTKVGETRNRRSVWSVNTKPFKGAHFAVMPEALVEPCLLAGSKEGDLLLDPFTGSGTVAVVALRHGRSFVGCELNANYAKIARARIFASAPLFAMEVEP